MSEGVLWIMLMIIFMIVESITVNLVTIWFAIASFFTMIIAILGFSLSVQVIIFFSFSLFLLFLTKPLLDKRMKTKKKPTNSDRIIGEVGVVLKDIDTIAATGQIKVMGQIWTATSKTKDTFIVGDKVKIVGIDGVKAIIEKKNKK